MASHSFTEIWNIGKTDVHPALYYFMLKFLNLIFGKNTFVYRLFSVIPTAILGIIGLTHIRKDFGEKSGLMFSFLILFLPGIMKYDTQIRMYSWAMLFVTLTAIYGYRLYNNQFTFKNTFIFGIFSFLSACIHYYGTMTAGLINLFLFIYYIINYKNKKKELFEYIICALIQIILYIPWLYVLIEQVTLMNRVGFWVTLTFPGTLYNLVKVQFDNSFNISTEVLCGIIGILNIYILYLLYKTYKLKDNIKPGMIALCLYVLVIFAAYVISKLTTPILLDRYLIVITGLLIFYISYFLSKEKNKILLCFLGIIIAISSVYTTINYISRYYSKDNTEVFDYINTNIHENDSFIIYNDNIEGFSVTIKYDTHMKYFHDPLHWGAGGAYEAFGPNLVIKHTLSEILGNVKGRIWIITNVKDDVSKKLSSDFKILDKKAFKTSYNGTDFLIVLIEEI